MADFDVSRAIPASSSDERQPQFDVSRAVAASSAEAQPAEPLKNANDPIALYGDPRQDTLKNMDQGQKDRMDASIKAGGAALQVIRWPFWRYIEHPVSTLVEGAQQDNLNAQTVGRALQAYVPFKQIPVEEYGSYGKV